MTEEDVMFPTEEKRSAGGYTIWKEIVGTLIGVAPFALAFFLWMSNVQTRLAVLEEARVTQAYRDSAQDANTSGAIARIEKAQEDIKKSVEEIGRYLRDNRIRER
jgi:hypothetical protein